jgi:hypothetical protein
MAKVNEQTKLKPASFQVIENLRTMLASEFGDSLQLFAGQDLLKIDERNFWHRFTSQNAEREFDDYFVVADKIGEIFLAQDSPSVLQGQSELRDCRNATMLEFNSETFLVNGLVKAAALVLVNSKHAPMIA